MRGAEKAGAEPGAQPHRPGDRPVLQRHQDRLAARQRAGARACAERGSSPSVRSTWLAWHLTGNRTHVTDVSNASRTLLFNIHTNDWDAELLELMRVPRAILPDVHMSAHAFGMLPANVLGEPLVIGGMAGDQQAAMFGQACHRAGMAKNTYGTGCFMLLHTGDKVVQSSSGLISTACAQTKGKEFALEGSVFVGGAVVQWLRDGLEFSSSSEVERLAASVLDSGDVYVVPAFTGLGAPYWDPDARGSIPGSPEAQLARTLRAPRSIDRLPERGAARGYANGFTTTFVGTARGRRCGRQRPAHAVPGRPARRSRGASAGAGNHGARRRLPRRPHRGSMEIARELESHWKAERRFEPRMSASERQQRMSRWREAVTRARRWVKVGSSS